MAYTYNGIDYNSRLDISIRARNLVYQADYLFNIALSDAEAVYLIREHKDEIADYRLAADATREQADEHILLPKVLEKYGGEFIDPFSSTVEYPGDALLDGLDQDTLYDYVPNSFLNGLVNHTVGYKAYMLHRYEELGHDEAIEKIQKAPHPKLRDHDDVILIRTSHAGSKLWLFYFDCDSSDCAIGWTKNTERNQKYLEDYCKKLSRNGPPQEFQLQGTGWISS